MKNVEVILPHLVNNTSWYVEYGCYNPKKDKIERFRVYRGFDKLKTDEEKNKLSQKLISQLTRKLKGGWRPWDKGQYIYRDETEYRSVAAHFGNERKNSSHIHKNLSEFLSVTKINVSAKTYESYQSKTRLFCQWLDNNGYENCRINELTNAVVKKFFSYLIEERKLDRLTIEKYQQNLTQMFRFFKKKNLTDEVPTSDIEKPPKVKDMAARPIMDMDMRAFMNYVAKNDQQLLFASLMQFFLCCRPGNELRLMKIQDIDLYNNQVHITQENGKTGKRMITMPDALVELCQSMNLTQYPRDYYVFSKDGKPGSVALGKNYFTRKFAKYRDELKLPKVYKFYSFKHTGAGKLMEGGATLSEIMSHLGHKSFESTIAYVRRHFGEKSQKVLDFRPDVLNGFLK